MIITNVFIGLTHIRVDKTLKINRKKEVFSRRYQIFAYNLVLYIRKASYFNIKKQHIQHRFLNNQYHMFICTPKGLMKTNYITYMSPTVT